MADKMRSGSVPLKLAKGSRGRLPEPPVSAQFHQTATCQQHSNPEGLARLKNHPVVVWVQLPAAIAPCGHMGYRIIGISHEGIRIKNKEKRLYVCEKMGHLIE